MNGHAHAIWQGGLLDGKGSLSTESGFLDNVQYSFGSRFDDGEGTSPEELIAAAHAGCFSMALSKELAERDLTPRRIETSATAKLEKTADGFELNQIHLKLIAVVPGADRDIFEQAANRAKETCPVSQVLNANISLEAELHN